MKTNYIVVFAAVCFSAAILVSCESHEQKADEAFEKVKEEKKDSQSASNDYLSLETQVNDTTTKTEVDEVQKPEIIIKTINTDDWGKFKSEIDKKILANENKIKAIKSSPEPNTKLLSELTGLENDFNDLKRKIDEHNEELRQELVKFKLKMNHEINEMAIELDNKINSNKK